MRFIKYNPDSDMAKYLQTKPIANHLANIIATRARRTYCPITGLKIGQCFLGDYKKIGISEQQYRTAKKELKRIGLATFTGTTKGTVANLVSTDVYDINVKAPNGLANGSATDEQRVTKNLKNKRIKEIEESSLSESLKLLFEEYLKMRIKKGKKFSTSRALKTRIKRVENIAAKHGEPKALECINATLDNEWIDIKLSYLEDKNKPNGKTDKTEQPQKEDLEAYILEHHREVDLKHMKRDGRFQRWSNNFEESKFKLTNVVKSYKNESFTLLFLFEALYMPLSNNLGGSNPNRKLDSLQRWYSKLNDYHQNKGNMRELLKEHNKSKTQ
jgi:hypothetical protein